MSLPLMMPKYFLAENSDLATRKFHFDEFLLSFSYRSNFLIPMALDVLINAFHKTSTSALEVSQKSITYSHVSSEELLFPVKQLPKIILLRIILLPLCRIINPK